MSEIDACYRRAREEDHEAYAGWVHLCELPLRRSLRSFAAAVDVESVLQEGLLRMWRLAPKLELTGEDASLRYARRLVRNLALAEARRWGRIGAAEIERLESTPEASDDGDDPPDDGLRDALGRRLEKLPAKPRDAITARLRDGGRAADRDLSTALGMVLNTFLQNIVRARRLLRERLRRAGITLEDDAR